MKKAVAVVLALFVVAMGTMFVWGFIDKQIKESSVQSDTNTNPTNTSDNNTTTKSADSDSSQQSESTASISPTELAKHKIPSDCWLAINGSVYNVTNYVDMHPGGADLILMYCGKDATQAYNTQGGRGRSHSSRADTLLMNYKVGTLK